MPVSCLLSPVSRLLPSDFCLLAAIIATMKILSAAEMREVDRLTTERCGVPSLLLMENAAAQTVQATERKFGDLGTRQQRRRWSRNSAAASRQGCASRCSFTGAHRRLKRRC